jgi:predicted RNase H-like HicB family nuclease
LQFATVDRIDGLEPLLSSAHFPDLYTPAIIQPMESAKYIYWQDNNQWLGYLQEYPDYWTQGESLEDLQANLRDLFRDLTSGEIPGIRKLAELALR